MTKKKWMIVLAAIGFAAVLALSLPQERGTPVGISPANAAYKPDETPGIETTRIRPVDGCCSSFDWYPLTGDSSN